MRVKSLLVATSMTAFGLPAGAAADCTPEAETTAARLAGVDPAGDPLLADGRAIRLLGIAPRQDAAEAARFGAGLRPFLGRDVELSVLGGPDRWNRWPARIFIPASDGEGQRQELALVLQRSGAALRLPEANAEGCAPASAPVQKTVTSRPPPSARTAVDGHDLAAVKAQEGRYVMLEGRIASVGERSQRTYLNFSRRPGEAASIVLSRSLWRELKGAGWTASSLGGKRVRAHGVLSGRNGLLLEATSRAALELID